MLTAARCRPGLPRREVYLIVLGAAVSIGLVLSYFGENSIIVNPSGSHARETPRKTRPGSRKQRGPDGEKVAGDTSEAFISRQRQEWLQAQQAKRANGTFNLRPGSGFMRQQHLIQRDRKQAIREACKRYPKLADQRFNSKNMRNMFAADKNRLFYCSVPKTGCTNWKKVLLVMEGDYKHTWNITGSEAHHPKAHPGPRQLFTVTSSERNYIMYTYLKFMYVRHPFVRLLSAYRNKIDRDIAQQDPNFQNYCRDILARYRPGADLDGLRASGRYGVTWAEWVRYLTDPAQRDGFNAHWREYHKLCLPCRIQYDFVGKLETVEADSSYMLGVLGVDGVSYPVSNRVKSADVYQQYFGNVSRRDLRKLWAIYKYDFELFGFEKPKELEERAGSEFSSVNETDLLMDFDSVDQI